MSTSLLYHTWGIRGYDYIHARYENGCTIFRVEQKESSLRSSCCGSREVKKRGATERTFKTTPVGNRPVLIEAPVQRVECLECGVVRQVNVQFAKQRRSYTKGFERYALELSRHMTIQDVARHLGVSWDTIKDIQKRYLHRRFNKPKLRKLKRIAIDEIYLGSRSGYLTVVMDLSSGAVIEVAEDGATAKGVWVSPGFTTMPTMEKLQAYWHWDRYGVDFIKEDGQWKIWHFFVGRVFTCPYEKGWVETVADGQEAYAMPLAIFKDWPGFTEPHAAQRNAFESYSPFEVARLQPRLPEPYRTFSETFSY